MIYTQKEPQGCRRGEFQKDRNDAICDLPSAICESEVQITSPKSQIA
jgi:hypothetical protein